MAKGPFVGEIVEFSGGDIIVVNGIGRPKEIRLPEEVVRWLRESVYARMILKELVTHYRFRARLTHPGAIRSLVLLLYARAHGEAPYRVARRYGVSPEQLYRIERGLRRDGLLEYVLNVLSLEGE